MATLKEGRAASKKVANVETPEQAVQTAHVAAVDVPRNADGSINYGALYDAVDATKKNGASPKHVGVGAEQIREVIDGLFSNPDRTEVKVATVEGMVNEIYGLKKEGEEDNRIQNSSVRSAGTVGGKYLIDSTSGTAMFKKNPNYDPNAPKKARVPKTTV